MTLFKTTYCRLILFLLLCLPGSICLAQNNLDKIIAVNVQQKRLADLLTQIAKQGHFYFSYSSDMLPGDSLVTLSAGNQTVRHLLDELFHNTVDYKETPGYIILRPTPYRLRLIPDNTEEPENLIIISGYVADEVTGKKLPNASVFEKHLLVSTLTDRNGFFKLKMKASGTIVLTVSKAYYRDTTVSFLSKITVGNSADNYAYTPELAGNKTERNWLGRAFVSSRLRIQSMNIGGFISGVPVQTSLLPGLGNHGLMSGQIVNNFSLNVLGGLSAGVNGLEIGGLYNLNKQDISYVQVAGLFNVVGGNATGVQVAGLSNAVYSNLNGIQVGGLINKVTDTVRGLQVGGLVNTSAKTVYGTQVTGLLNKVADTVRGMQVAGLANITGKAVYGFQLAGIINKAHTLNGVHIAAVNIADTLNGCAIGLLNFARNGYHQVGVYTDENLINSVYFKTGNKALYTKLIGGINFTGTDTYFAYGAAFGHDFEIGKQSLLSTEFSSQFISSSHWNHTHQLYRFAPLINLPLASKTFIFFGPSVNLYDLEKNNTPDELDALTKNKIALTGIGTNFKMWVGWTVGIASF